MKSEAVIRKAGERLADFIAEQLLIHWRVEETETTQIALAITGTSVGDLAQFKAVLRSNIAGVRQLIQRRYSEEGALVEVGYTGNASELARSIRQTRFGLFTVQLVGVGPQRLDIQILP